MDEGDQMTVWTDNGRISVWIFKKSVSARCRSANKWGDRLPEGTIALVREIVGESRYQAVINGRPCYVREAVLAMRAERIE
jgi:hypothetical protein